MAWESAPAPNYPTFNPYYFGNALSNLVNNYQQAQQGQQRTQANSLRNQQDQLLLNQEKAFAGGVPMNPDGTPNYSAIMKTLAEKGDINAVSSLAPIIQQQQNIQGANAPDPFFGGGYSTGSGNLGKTASASDLEQELIIRGYSPTAAAGIVGNLGQESGFNSGSIGDKGTSGGLAQWHGDRLAQLEQYAISQGKDWRDPQVQLDFLDKEVRQNPQLYASLNAAKTPGQAADIFMSEFERPAAATADAERREAIAENVSGSQVASLDGSDVTAYATPETPAVPPVSAAAGSSIPRANAPTATAAVGGPTPQPSAVPQQLAANNPAWGGINAALPVGAAGAPSPAPMARPTPQAPAGTAAPAQGSVASIASVVGIPPNVAANIAKAVGAAPDAPLTPQQADRAKAIVQAYLQRRGPQTPQGGQGQPSPSGPIIPQFPLPKGFTDPQQAILAIDQDIARLSRFGPAASGRIRVLEDMRDRIAKSSAPLEMHAGTTILDPRTGRTIIQTPFANANTMALQAFMEEHPNATAEEVQQFISAGRGSRSGVGMFMQAYKLEHPNADAEEIAHAAQDFQSGGTALTRFTSGPQGNAIRSFNVLVDHLGTLGQAADELKNGNTRVANQIAQEIARQTGSPAPTDFDATKGVVSKELVKAITGGAGALADREEVQGDLDKANSPAQLAGVIEKYKKLALGQLRGLRLQYENATGRDDFNAKLAPGTLKFFGDEQATPSPAAGGATTGSGDLPPGWSVEVH